MLSKNEFEGLLISAKTSKTGNTPKTPNKIIPGNKKSLNGDLFNSDNGIPISLPLGEIINTPPPNSAPSPRNNSKKRRMFRAVFDVIILNLKFYTLNRQ